MHNFNKIQGKQPGMYPVLFVLVLLYLPHVFSGLRQRSFTHIFQHSSFHHGILFLKTIISCVPAVLWIPSALPASPPPPPLYFCSTVINDQQLQFSGSKLPTHARSWCVNTSRALFSLCASHQSQQGLHLFDFTQGWGDLGRGGGKGGEQGLHLCALE